MTVTGERPDILLEDVDFNRRDHPDRPLRPIPPGRDHFADQWRYMREFIFGEWIDIEKELEPSDLTRLRDDYFWQRDELMTGVVEAFERLGHEQGRALFEQALTQGIDTLDDPPQELVDLFEHLDNLPAQFDLESAERGRMLAMSSTFAATTIIRGWAFYETAMTGDISAATGATGRFADDGPRRFIETARVFAEFTLPDIFDRNSDAFQDVVRVRLMHALASKGGLRRKWGRRCLPQVRRTHPGDVIARVRQRHAARTSRGPRLRAQADLATARGSRRVLVLLRPAVGSPPRGTPLAQRPGTDQITELCSGPGR